MTADFPLVSIIMATYNRAGFIAETLRSIQNQTYKNWECIIVDDGGTDNTAEVIRPLLEADSRIRLYKRPDKYLKGLPGTRNYGLDLAQGDFIVFFDDDDIVHPLNLELCLKEIRQHDVSFCRYIREVFYGNFKYDFDYSTSYHHSFIDKNDVGNLLTELLPFNSCAVVWKKDCFANQRYTEHLKHAEEWELYSRILSDGRTGISIEKSLFFARKHDNSMTGKYFRFDPVRTQSNIDAILLVVADLREKKMLTRQIMRHFVLTAVYYKEYSLFSQIMKTSALDGVAKWRWKLFYFILPLRLGITKIKKKILGKLR